METAYCPRTNNGSFRNRQTIQSPTNNIILNKSYMTRADVERMFDNEDVQLEALQNIRLLSHDKVKEINTEAIFVTNLNPLTHREGGSSGFKLLVINFRPSFLNSENSNGSTMCTNSQNPYKSYKKSINLVNLYCCNRYKIYYQQNPKHSGISL